PVSSQLPTGSDDRPPALPPSFVTIHAIADAGAFGTGRNLNATVIAPTVITTLAASNPMPTHRADALNGAGRESRAPSPDTNGGGGDDCANTLRARSSFLTSGSASPLLSQR